MPESDVQIPPDSTGKLIDTQAATRPDASIVQQQKLIQVKSSGDAYHGEDISNVELLVVMRDVRALLLLIANAMLNQNISLDDLQGLH